jgi:hypothetical protein
MARGKGHGLAAQASDIKDMRMFPGDKRRLFLMAALMAVAGFTAACESAAERQARLEREAYIKSLNVEELKKSLETVNPDHYSQEEVGTPNRGRFRND